MTHVCITYHMERKNEVAETCITLPMDDFVAAMLLSAQEDCFQLMEGASLNVLLRELSKLQGYTYAGFCCAELDQALEGRCGGMKHFTKREWAKKERVTPGYIGRWEATPFNLDRIAAGELPADYIGRRNMLDYEPNHGTVLLTEGYHFTIDDEEGRKYFEQEVDARRAGCGQRGHEGGWTHEL